MKRHYEDPSLELIGRSAAERRLDRFYNHQRSTLRKTDSTPPFALDSKAREHKDLPFQPSDTSTPIPPKPRTAEPSSRKSVGDILSDLSQRHLVHRNRFAKSLRLLTKLTKGYLDDKNNVEYSGVTMADFLNVFYRLDRIFVVEFGGDVPKDCLEEKEAALEFVDSVVDRLLKDGLESPQEKQLLELIKIDIGYAASLWYENDSFRFHAVVSQLESRFKHFESIASDVSTSVKSDTSSKHPCSNIAESADHADATITDTNSVKKQDYPEQTGLSQPVLPSETELLMLQKASFVRVLAVVFNFYTFPWAKVAIESLFQNVYLRRELFSETDQQRISEWQKHIKASKGKTYKGGSIVRGIGESAFEVKDARDEKIIGIHGSQVWSNRQFGI
ncbi:hypothetical protein BaOVIS_018730 [Babesia ovis]|uniref:Uncharacterized protein n=1 Tax=Babesia ovis TaxID=5869 RepID=A0A9W5TAB1_BABOV|nr:hypothetical protein BaOVIS_018730 [Babesia ovis]